MKCQISDNVFKKGTTVMLLMRFFTIIILSSNISYAMQHQNEPAQVKYNPRDYARALAGDKNLAGANLEGAIFENTDFSDVNFTDTNLSDAQLRNVTLNRAQFVRTNLRKAYISCHNCDDVIFDNVHASHSNLSYFFPERARLINSQFSHAKFRRVFFHNSTLTNVNFSGTTFEENCGFMKSTLNHINMHQCIINNFLIGECSLRNIDLSMSKINKLNVRLFREIRYGDNVSTAPLIDGRTWENIALWGSTIINSLLVGHVAPFNTPEADRNQELQSFKYPWYTPLLNPLLAFKRMLGNKNDYDEYNIDSVLIGVNLEGATLLGLSLTNIILRNCAGADSLERGRGCFFSNIVVENANQNTCYRISTK